MTDDSDLRVFEEFVNGLELDATGFLTAPELSDEEIGEVLADIARQMREEEERQKRRISRIYDVIGAVAAGLMTVAEGMAMLRGMMAAWNGQDGSAHGED